MPLIVVECKINCPGIAVSANCLVQSDCQRNVIGLDKKQTWGWAQLAVDQAFFGLMSFYIFVFDISIERGFRKRHMMINLIAYFAY